MFSVPVQIIDTKNCNSGYDHDLCIDNSDENICPQNVNGAPIVCSRNGQVYLVGLAKSNNKIDKRSDAIAVANINQYNVDIDTFVKTSFEFRGNEKEEKNLASPMIPMLDLIPFIITIFIDQISKKNYLKC